jgi:hypothetical protein
LFLSLGNPHKLENASMEGLKIEEDSNHQFPVKAALSISY